MSFFVRGKEVVLRDLRFGSVAYVFPVTVARVASAPGWTLPKMPEGWGGL